jgi:ribonuclease-3
MAVRDPLEPAAHGCELTETALGHRFARPELLREALTHRSAVGGARLSRGRQAPSTGAGSNERLEFLGDRVLGLLMAEWLIERFPSEQEGLLGRRHAHLVSQPVIAAIAEQIGLPALLSVSAGESRAGVRTRATVTADATEALIGALYLDGGLEPARAFVRRAWTAAIEAQVAPPKDAKTALQEWLLGRGEKLPEYQVVAVDGPPHEPVFTIRVEAGGAHGQGRAGSKREAERLAAEDLLGKLAS